jgi:hypothetical protein
LEWAGFAFENLTAGVEITIRASATGYGTKEMTLLPRPWRSSGFFLTVKVRFS